MPTAGEWGDEFGHTDTMDFHEVMKMSSFATSTPLPHPRRGRIYEHSVEGGMVVNTCNPSIQGKEAGGLRATVWLSR